MTRPILVYIDAQRGVPSRSALQAVTAARTLAQATGASVVAVALGDAAEVASAYADRVLQVARQAKTQDALVHVLTEALARSEAAALLMAANRTAQAVLPRVAIRADGAYLEDVTRLAHEEGSMRATRLAQLQRIAETLISEADVTVASVKAGAYEPASPLPERGSIERLEVAEVTQEPRVQVAPAGAAPTASVGLDEATIVVAGGRGIGSKEDFERLVVPLATRLGAAVGATRAAVDAGWRPYDEQIGQTGKTVAPDVYLALGISGAVQHLSGMRGSRTVIAVNHDADAAIFKQCDVGIVGDVEAIVPALLEALENA